MTQTTLGQIVARFTSAQNCWSIVDRVPVLQIVELGLFTAQRTQCIAPPRLAAGHRGWWLRAWQWSSVIRIDAVFSGDKVTRAEVSWQTVLIRGALWGIDRAIVVIHDTVLSSSLVPRPSYSWPAGRVSTPLFAWPPGRTDYLDGGKMCTPQLSHRWWVDCHCVVTRWIL